MICYKNTPYCFCFDLVMNERKQEEWNVHLIFSSTGTQYYLYIAHSQYMVFHQAVLPLVVTTTL